MKQNKTRKLFGYVLLFGIIFFFTISQSTQAAFPGSGEKIPSSFSDLADKVKHPVVNISTTKVVKGSPLQPFFGPNGPIVSHSGGFEGIGFAIPSNMALHIALELIAQERCMAKT